MSPDAGVTVVEKATEAAQQTAQQAPQLAVQFWLMLALPFLVFFLVMLVRALPWSEGALSRKPLSCNACLSFWVTAPLIYGVSWFFNTNWPWALIHVLAAPGGAMLLLAVHARLTAPVELPLPLVPHTIPKLKRLLRRRK